MQCLKITKINKYLGFRFNQKLKYVVLELKKQCGIQKKRKSNTK